MHTDNLRKLARETNDGVLRGPAFVAADEIDRLRAEIKRLTKERDEARAQVAAAYKAAEQANVFMAEEGGFLTRVPLLPETKAAIRALTPADAQAALEAYGRSKVQEGMQRAADIAAVKPRRGGRPLSGPHHAGIRRGRSEAARLILAEMEKLK